MWTVFMWLESGRQTTTITALETEKYTAASTAVEIAINRAHQEIAAPEVLIVIRDTIILKTAPKGHSETVYIIL